jgi:hypothetical protein
MVPMDYVSTTADPVTRMKQYLFQRDHLLALSPRPATLMPPIIRAPERVVMPTSS